MVMLARAEQAMAKQGVWKVGYEHYNDIKEYINDPEKNGGKVLAGHIHLLSRDEFNAALSVWIENNPEKLAAGSGDA